MVSRFCPGDFRYWRRPSK